MRLWKNKSMCTFSLILGSFLLTQFLFTNDTWAACRAKIIHRAGMAPVTVPDNGRRVVDCNRINAAGVDCSQLVGMDGPIRYRDERGREIQGILLHPCRRGLNRTTGANERPVEHCQNAMLPGVGQPSIPRIDPLAPGADVVAIANRALDTYCARLIQVRCERATGEELAPRFVATPQTSVCLWTDDIPQGQPMGPGRGGRRAPGDRQPAGVEMAPR